MTGGFIRREETGRDREKEGPVMTEAEIRVV